MDVETKGGWRGREARNLSDQELCDAIMFCEMNYDELKSWAPISVWSFFSTILADLTVEQARRLKKSK